MIPTQTVRVAILMSLLTISLIFSAFASYVFFTSAEESVKYIVSFGAVVVAYKIKIGPYDDQIPSWYYNIAKLYDMLLLIFGISVLFAYAGYMFGLL